MEVVHHRYKVSPKGEDIVSSMPDIVIASIMNRLPLKEAVATSAITKLVLNKPDWIELDVEDINHRVMFLSRIRGFEELTLTRCHKTPAKFPSHLFSCLDLKRLRLDDCVLSPPPYFHGFPKLLTLDLHDVSIRDHKYEELIALSPLLENLEIRNSNLIGEVKLVEIAKLKNLKMILMPLCMLDNMTKIRLSTVLQHLSCLPKLQELCLEFKNYEFLPEDFSQNRVSATFPFLKELCLYNVDFSRVSMFSCAFGMLFVSPNLQYLYITAMYKNVVPIPAIFPPDVDCSTMGQLQLRNVDLDSVKGLENEVWLIKYILACSPMLKSIKILLDETIESNEKEKYKLASKLLKLHRASPIAEVIFLD
uniref:F-box/FBD/LRR-repeat protein At1g13570-like n=1 Tax=Erigeron canadensis TaxID=72917 RepID=UPI001CB94B83|nr:F-box/FBD/LRR-repeat protein At1g13570-like [Erigeron canadensis]